MPRRTIVVTLIALAAASSLAAQAAEVALDPVEVPMVAGWMDYFPFAIAIGGKQYQGFGRLDLAVRFDVSHFERFRAAAGSRDGGDRAGGEMMVEVDGRTVWRQRVRPGEPARTLDIDLQGHHYLILRSYNGDCIFAEPRLVYRLPAPVAGPTGTVTGLTRRRADAVVKPATGPLAGQAVYHNSFALLVGVNEYAQLPQDRWLHYAVNDVNAVREMLVGSYGFAPENVVTLYNGNATLERIREALAKLADASIVQAEDRVLVYFSGHGQTVKLARGGEMGFLIPYDAAAGPGDGANPGPYLATCLPMNSIWGTLEASPAKHVLLLADACYSGLMTHGETGAPAAPTTADLAAMSARRAMQVITAGRQGDVSTEDPALGHGSFTYKLLDAMRATAATPGAVLTASQLHSTVRASVMALTQSHQTPQIGSYGTEGDFLFVAVPPFAPLAPRPGQPAVPAQPAVPLQAAVPPEPIAPPEPVAAPEPLLPGVPTDVVVGPDIAPPVPPMAGPNGHRYAVVDVPAGLTWAQSYLISRRQVFRGLRGHLVTMTTPDEANFVAAILRGARSPEYWIGSFQDLRAPDYREPAGGWRWVTGEPWDYTQWNQALDREPNDANHGEDVGSIMANGNWNDYEVGSLLHGYIVEYEPATK